MSSSSESKQSKKDRKHDRKEKKKHKKKEKKKRKLDKDVGSSAVSASPVPAPVAPPRQPSPPRPPPPDLSKMTAEEKRKLLSAGRGARKAAYAGTELGGPQQAKFKKFLRIDEGTDAAGAKGGGYNPAEGTPTPADGERLEAALEQQFNKALQYQFGGGMTANRRRGLGSN